MATKGGVLKKREGKSMFTSSRWTDKWIEIDYDTFKFVRPSSTPRAVPLSVRFHRSLCRYFATDKEPKAGTKPRKEFKLSQCTLATEGPGIQSDLSFELRIDHGAKTEYVIKLKTPNHGGLQEGTYQLLLHPYPVDSIPCHITHDSGAESYSEWCEILLGRCSNGE